MQLEPHSPDQNEWRRYACVIVVGADPEKSNAAKIIYVYRLLSGFGILCLQNHTKTSKVFILTAKNR